MTVDDAGISVRVPDAAYYREQVRCQAACPVNTDARGYVRAITAGDLERAYLIARSPNPFPSLCGRICGAPCEEACRRADIDAPVAIRQLKRFVTERALRTTGLVAGSALLDDALTEIRSGAWSDVAALLPLRAAAGVEGRSVGVIGAGPAGLAAAHDLVLLGYQVVVYEAEAIAGGMFRIGIPAYRLSPDIVAAEIAAIQAVGVDIRYGITVGEQVTFRELRDEHDAILIAIGAKKSRPLALPGANLEGIFGGVEFLREIALGPPVTLGRRIVVIGGGNVAYDVARSAIRRQHIISHDIAQQALRLLSAKKVTVACLESREDMPADDYEVLGGATEGIELLNSLGPVEFIDGGDGKVAAVRFKRCLSIFDAAGRFAPVFDDDDVVTIDADTVFTAIGQQSDFSFLAGSKVELGPRGLVMDQATMTTSEPDIFAAGDVAMGPGLAIHAIANGKRVALSIHRFITQSAVETSSSTRLRVIEDDGREIGYEKIQRQSMPPPRLDDLLISGSHPIEITYYEKMARREASRCLDCQRNTVFDSERCIACAACVDVCPEGCLRLVSLASLRRVGQVAEVLDARYGDDPQGAAIIKDDTRCIRCALCARRCPTRAITMEALERTEELVNATDQDR